MADLGAMARRRILLIAGIAVVALIVIFVGSRRGPSLAFSFGVREMDFSSDRGPTAWLAMTNEGSVAAKWGYRGGWVEIETADGSFTNDLSGGGIMEPGAKALRPIWLPPETLRWRVRYVVSEASLRQRVSFKLRNRWDGIVRRVGREVLPNREGPPQTICSGFFDAQNFVQKPPEVVEDEVDLIGITNMGL